MQLLIHEKPVRFVEEVVRSEEFDSETRVVFPSTPTLAMFFEAAAQTSVFLKLRTIKQEAGVSLDKPVEGVLIKTKVKYCGEPEGVEYRVKTHYVYNLENFFVVDFEVLENGEKVVEGQLHSLVSNNNVNVLELE